MSERRIRVPRTRRKRNVIGAPIPADVLSPVLDRLHDRLNQVEFALRILRVGLSVLALVVLSVDPAAPRLSVTLVAAYALLALATLRAKSEFLDRSYLVGDIVFLPLLFLPTLAAKASIHLVVATIGLWIVLNALTGDPRRTRDRIGAFSALLILGAITAGATVSDLVVAVFLCWLAIKVARVQQYRLVGQTIQSAERIQRALALPRRRTEDIGSTS